MPTLYTPMNAIAAFLAVRDLRSEGAGPTRTSRRLLGLAPFPLPPPSRSTHDSRPYSRHNTPQSIDPTDSTTLSYYSHRSPCRARIEEKELASALSPVPCPNGEWATSRCSIGVLWLEGSSWEDGGSKGASSSPASSLRAPPALLARQGLGHERSRVQELIYLL